MEIFMTMLWWVSFKCIFSHCLSPSPLQYHMVAKAAIDQLLVFVNYSEPGDANGSSHLGVDSPSRTNSPDVSNALLFKDAVEIVAEDEGKKVGGASVGGATCVM